MTLPVYVALLRGINVGGNNMLPMKALARMFEHAGAKQVTTYIQSGNVVFQTGNDPERVTRGVSAAIAQEYGYKISMTVRSDSELASAAKRNPFRTRTAEPKYLYIGFLDTVPTRARAAGLDPSRSPGDEFKLIGRELHVHYAAGAGKSKFTNAYVDSVLGTLSTFRNLRTVDSLVEMCRAQKLRGK